MMAESLADQVYETIKKDILTCVLQPGEQIAQPQLAEKYQTGTTPIREALQRLAREGLVQPIPRFGYIVTPITLADVTEIYELRSILEAAAARLAAVRGPQEQIDKIAELADYTYVYKDRSSYSNFIVHNTVFHRSVAVATGNDRLVESISKLLDELTRLFHLRLDFKDSAEEMRAEHKALAEALCRRDPDEAERLVQAQIAHSQQRILEAFIASAGGSSISSALGQMVLGRSA
jgi:DNA-binding GntR family transcriptional regulator